jgi:hypothetical protein
LSFSDLHVKQHLSTTCGGGSLAENSSSSTENPKRPAVVLIGWLGAQERYFDK